MPDTEQAQALDDRVLDVIVVRREIAALRAKKKHDYNIGVRLQKAKRELHDKLMDIRPKLV